MTNFDLILIGTISIALVLGIGWLLQLGGMVFIIRLYSLILFINFTLMDWKIHIFIIF